LHPDTILLPAVLAFAWAHADGRLPLAAFFAGLAALAKPTGLLVVGLSLILPAVPALRATRVRRRVLLLSALIALVVSSPTWLALRPEMLLETLHFGRLESVGSWPERLGWGALLLLLHAGVILPIAMIAALRNLRGDLAAGRILGGAFLVLFFVAAIANGQLKENWIMPSFILFWPRDWRVSRPIAGLLLLPSVLFSGALGLVMHRPSIVAAAERGASALASTYPLVAGSREEQVSATSTWTERLREYQPIDRLATQLATQLATAETVAPSWIVSRDYGLAAQLAYVWREDATRIAVLADPIYARTVMAAREGELGRGAVALGLDATELPPWPGVGQWADAAPVVHPQTDEMLAVARRTEDALHAPFDALLKRYVRDGSVRYDAWRAEPSAVRELTAYVDALEATAPSGLSKEATLAYWINLYNATTLDLILVNEPVGSIKDLGGLLKSPWKKKLVTVEGRELSLDRIENEIIRPTSRDPRIHFALNCASIGCPPLAADAYRAADLDSMLDAQCRLALADPRWLAVQSDGERSKVRLTKIFDWYGQDFEEWGGGLRRWVARYAPERAARALDDPATQIEFMDYDWNLNRTE